MNEIFEKILKLISLGEIIISDHGYDELAEDGILVMDVMNNVTNGKVIEQYPDYHKGQCVLVLQKDINGNPIHVVWGIPRNNSTPAVLITAYKPDSLIWDDNFMERIK
ncbi:MAG: DUF4258 domain-containing protein [Nitrospirae bacterium]|nr:DUF4258 domain-containing protein [Nitrospirota bacterium]